MPTYRNLLLITGIAIALLFIKLGAASVFQVAEARNSQVPVEMFQSNDFVVPYFNGEMRADKPPLHYYAMLLAYKTAGIKEANARFFSALCGLLVIIATYFFTKRNAGAQAALWASLILLASLHTIFQFRLATPDPYLVACHTLSLFCFWEGYKTAKKQYFFLMYLCWGLAILAKGPVGFVLPAGAVFLYLLFKRQFNWKVLKSMQLLWGMMIVLAIAFPWFYFVHARTNGAWTNSFFIEHNIDRFSKPLDKHGGPVFLPLLFVIAGLFPFSIFMIRAIGFAWRQRGPVNWLFFNLLAVACVVIPYAISATKLINYTVPAYPFLAIITGVYIKDWTDTKTNRIKLLPEWIILLATTVALPVAVFYWMKSDPALYPIRMWSSVLLLFSVATMASFYYYLKLRVNKAFYMVAIGGIAQNVLFFAFLYPELDACSAVQKQKSMIASVESVVAYRNFNPAFTFYHKKPIEIVSSAAAVSEYLGKHPSALVLERARQPCLNDSLPQLSVLAKYKIFFSRQYSTIYRLKIIP